MRFGRYCVPENRFVPTALDDIKKICENTKDIHNFSGNELAAVLGYSQPHGGAYYRRSSSLSCYGLIEYKDRAFRVTEIGESVAYFKGNDAQRAQLYNDVILNVKLWKELHDRFPNGLPDNLPLHLRNIAAVDLGRAKEHEKNIKGWYTEDLKLVLQERQKELEANNYIQSEISSKREIEKPMISIGNSGLREGIEKIPFGDNILICLPKDNIRKWWEKAKKHMELFLEDHEESTSPDS